MKTIRIFIISLLLIVTGYNCNAQKIKPEPLEIFLHKVEERFNIIFSFADENIKGKFVSISLKDISLEKCLKELEQQTNLDYKKLNSRYIAIYRKVRNITISGIVVDYSTKEYLAGAIIYAGEKYAVSNKNGFFSLKTPKEDSILNIQYTGYKTLQIKNKYWTNDSSVYELIPDILKLEEIVINYIAKGINKLSDGTIHLNTQNIEILPGLSEPDILHSIQVLPGIQSTNETVSEINSRGGTNDQNLVLWDGVKMYQTGHFFGLISALNSNLINTTNIIKNGTSAAFSEGVSGTIDMKSQDYQVNKFSANAGLNMISADAMAKIPVSPKLSFIVGARHSINNILTTPTYDSYFKRAFEQTEVSQYNPNNQTSINDNNQFSFYDLSFKLLYDLSEKDKIRLSILDIYNKVESEENALTNDILQSKMSHLDQSSLLSNFIYTHSWNNNHSTSLSAYTSTYKLDGENVDLKNNQNHLQKNEVSDYGIRLDNKNRISSLLQLSSGYQLNEIGIRNLDNIQKPDYSRDIKEILLIHSLYSEAEFNKLFSKLYFRFGLRLNYIPKLNELLFEPRLALNFKLTENISIETLAEKKHQYTMQSIDYQTDFLGIEKRRWILSDNDDTPILKSKQYSLGINYNNNNFLLSFEGYQKDVDGIITPSQGFQNQFQYVYTTGAYNTYGLELLINKRFNKSNFWINYTFAKNKYYFKELSPSSFPNNTDIRHNLSLGGIYTIKDIELSAGFNYRTGNPYTKVSQNNIEEGNEIIYESPNGAHLKDFIRLDLSAKYNFKINNIRGNLGFSIWNILNRKNEIQKYYQQNNNQEIEQIVKHALGITPNITLRLIF